MTSPDQSRDCDTNSVLQELGTARQRCIETGNISIARYTIQRATDPALDVSVMSMLVAATMWTGIHPSIYQRRNDADRGQDGVLEEWDEERTYRLVIWE